jgi:PEP-CTERM motif
MHRPSFLSALAAALLACSVGISNATAGTEMVTSDGGTFDFTLTSNGHGSVTITDTFALLTTINGALPAGGPVAATFADITATVNLLVSAPPVTSYSLSGSSSKTYGDGTGSNATLGYSLTSAVAINPSFLNVDGKETGVSSPLLETSGTSPTIYNFSDFASGASLTETYTSVGANFASVIANGGTITGTGAFTDAVNATPEPSSMALLGIGVTAVLAFRRVFKRSARA